ncbi:hypothetical protein CYMTET_38994 [Cymbomonas tetramitiformis]|uniref:Uncharacterized protein n=1 Tax=Cymbomonas tetramitiformis TaxID=36881 RepID=A0AAE0CC28_9CHLO|nr:hypothetical protein CYMTET_38994 [Cymbomonas tetramitiformis]
MKVAERHVTEATYAGSWSDRADACTNPVPDRDILSQKVFGASSQDTITGLRKIEIQRNIKPLTNQGSEATTYTSSVLSSTAGRFRAWHTW